MSAWYDTMPAMRICAAIVAINEVGSTFNPQSACATTREAASMIGTAKVKWVTGFDGIREVGARTWMFDGVCEDLRRLLVELQERWIEQQMLAAGYRQKRFVTPEQRAAEADYYAKLLDETPGIDAAMDAYVDRRQQARAA